MTTSSPAAGTPAKVILLIEDDPLLIKMYRTKFTVEGFTVITSTDGETGLANAKTLSPDAVLLDIMMPKLDGLEVLRRIRQDPQIGNRPIFILSNLSEPTKQKQALELGASAYLIKANHTPSQVVAKVKQLLLK